MIKMEVQSTRAVIRAQEPLTVGLRGAKVHFSFGKDWQKLIKTAVFRQGDTTVTVAKIKEEVIIPWEVLTCPGVPVEIGIYGTEPTGTIAIPTLWAVTRPVRPGADPEADPSAEPTPGLWEQMQGQLEEANRAVYLVTLDSANCAEQSFGDILAAYHAGKVIQCDYQGGRLPLILMVSGKFTFAGVIDTTSYLVVVNERGDAVTVERPLAQKTDLPTKVSDLENDKGYLTEAPVKSVNGQIGDVHITIPTVPTTVSQLVNDKGYLTEAPVKSVNGQTGDVIVPGTFLVTVTKEDDGTYTSDKTYMDLLMAQAMGNTLLCFYADEGVYLPLVSSEGKLAFSAILSPYQYRIEFYLAGGDRPLGLRFSKTELASETAVLHTPQALTEEQQAQARENIGIVDGGVLETVLDFTTTETVTKINIPLDTDEMVEKLRNMTEFRMAILIPRDTEDTETTTNGKITVGLNIGWDNLLWSVEDAIIAPTITYSNYSRTYVVVPCNPNIPVSYTPIFITNFKDNLLSGATKTNITSLNSVIRNPKFEKGAFLRIEGTQYMAAGTRIIVEVRV